MEKIVSFFKKNAGKLKGIFLISVGVIVLVEILSISRTLSPAQLEDTFSRVSLASLVLLLIVGLVSVSPMLFYDFILTGMLPQKFKTSYILQTSWITNTINNLAGFGGLVSVGLRNEFYGKSLSGKQVFHALSKILIFLLSGLSIYCFVSLGNIIFLPVDQHIQRFWPWLLGGALYFPGVLIVTHYTKAELFSGLILKIKAALTATSFLEWTGVIASFTLVGIVLEVDFNLLALIPILVACSVIGMVSLLPGGLGSFDVMMILALGYIGVDKEVAVVWLLLYRIFYYIIPFLIGIVLFGLTMGSQINQRFANIPKEIAVKGSHGLLALSLYFSGIMMVLSATVPEAFKDYPLLSKLNPLSFTFITQIPSVVIGFLLLIMGRAAFSKVKRAYIPTLVLLIGTVLYVIWKDFSWASIGFLSLVTLFVLFSKSEYYRERFVYSWEMLTLDGLLYLALTLLYIFIGFDNSSVFHHRHQTPHFLLFPSERVWFSGLLGIALVSLFVILAVRYLSRGSAKVGHSFDPDRLRGILNEFGGNETSHLVFAGDKKVYYYQDETGADQVFFQFQLIADKCVIMGEPSGNKKVFQAAIAAFMHDADLQGHQLVFYEVKESFIMLLHEYGFDFLKMGEEGYVSVPEFSLTGRKFKSERSLMNRFERENYQFEIIQPPFSQQQLDELRAISTEWLGSRKEKGFSVGYFNDNYLSEAPIGIVKNQEGTILAFANLMPSYSPEDLSIDLMRHAAEFPSGVMDFLFISLFNYAKENGYESFNMGMAPFSNVGQSNKSFLQERIAYFIYEFGTRFYSFQGLRHYKEKYVTEWVPKYTAYPKNKSLIFTMLQLLLIINEPLKSQKSKE